MLFKLLDALRIILVGIIHPQSLLPELAVAHQNTDRDGRPLT